MWTLILKSIVLPLAIDGVKKYIDSTDSQKDDKVLELVQTGAEYLANKSNNTLTDEQAKDIKQTKMKTLQRVK